MEPDAQRAPPRTEGAPRLPRLRLALPAARLQGAVALSLHTVPPCLRLALRPTSALLPSATRCRGARRRCRSTTPAARRVRARATTGPTRRCRAWGPRCSEARFRRRSRPRAWWRATPSSRTTACACTRPPSVGRARRKGTTRPTTRRSYTRCCRAARRSTASPSRARCARPPSTSLPLPAHL